MRSEQLLVARGPLQVVPAFEGEMVGLLQLVWKEWNGDELSRPADTSLID